MAVGPPGLALGCQLFCFWPRRSRKADAHLCPHSQGLGATAAAGKEVTFFLRRASSSLSHLPLTQTLLSQGCRQVQADPKELLPEDAEPGLQGHPASMVGAPSLSPRLH